MRQMEAFILGTFIIWFVATGRAATVKEVVFQGKDLSGPPKYPSIQWPTVMLATAIVGSTVFIVAENDDNNGWIYVFLLLLAATLAFPHFLAEFLALDPAITGANIDAPQRQPGQTTGPF